MQIGKLVSAKSAGVLDGWRWPDSLPEWKKFNLIYGWNYSGKTTLARLFRSLELGGEVVGFPDATASFTGTSGELKAPDRPSNDVRVFNGDFVEANIQWGGEINSILLVGQRSIELEDQISRLREELEATRTAVKEGFDETQALEGELASALTERARFIKEALSLPGYTRPILIKTLSLLVGSLESARQSEERVNELLAQHQQREDRGTHEIPELDLNTSDVVARVKEALALEVDAESISELSENAEANRWARDGMSLHEAGSDCLYCLGNLTEARWAALKRHFSDSYRRIEALLEKIRGEIDSLRTVWSPPEPSQVYQDLQPAYRAAYSEATAVLKAHDRHLNALITSVDRRKNDPFVGLEVDIQTFDSGEETLGRCLALLKQHNNRTKNLSAVRDAAREALVNHYAAEFAIEFSYDEVNQSIRGAASRHSELNQKAQELEKSIKEKERQASDQAAGADGINAYLASFFHESDLTIVAVDERSFELRRGDQRARNLSEGEKTAISFAYFLTKLGESGFDRATAIVVIDDPISSLDSRHLFNVAALIQRELIDVGQLIVTTHSFEFFTLLRDWLNRERKGRNARLMMIERVGQAPNVRSRLAELPPVLRNFNSEYHYLFSKLADFHDTEDIDYELLYHLPNIARRFAEAFLGFKFPSKSGLRGKLPNILEDAGQRARLEKFLNTYSHNQTAARSTAFPDLSECKAVVGMLLDAVERADPEHVRCLREAISPEAGQDGGEGAEPEV